VGHQPEGGASDNPGGMTDDQTGGALTEAERAVAHRLLDEIGKFNLQASGIAEFHELLSVETDDDGELLAGV
jgi:hypothetical protein